MLSTYLNDNQHMAYPFFGDRALPFPSSCITGFGLCIQKDMEMLSVEYLFASNVIINADSVWMSICRKIKIDGSDDNHEEPKYTSQLLGIFYSNTSGYYIYIPSYVLDAVYENGDRMVSQEPLRLVYSLFADGVSEDVAEGMVADMQVFYSYIKEDNTIINVENRGCGYMLLGTIPENAIGSYAGEFYLDPRCITYMPEDVINYHQAYEADQMSDNASQVLVFNTAGMLGTHIDGSTVSFYRNLTGIEDTPDLVDIPNAYKNRVTGINGYQIGGGSEAYPELLIQSELDTVVLTGTSIGTSIVITIDGGEKFAPCKGAVNA